MSIEPSLMQSFKATSNGAFISAAPEVWARVREGETLHDALAATRLFPADFLSIVDVAETSGTVPEALDRLSPELEAQARRSLEALASVLAWLIWCLVAAFIVFLIFRIFQFYIGADQRCPQTGVTGRVQPCGDARFLWFGPPLASAAGTDAHKFERAGNCSRTI